MIGINVLSVFTLAVDTAMCGRLPNSETALKALGFATQIVFLLLVAMMGLTVGTVALVSRAYGAGEHKRVNHLLVQSTQLTFIVGVVVGGIGFVVAPQILMVLGATGAVIEQGARYLRPLMLGATFYYMTILYAAVMRGVGNTRIPFFCALAANALNVFLNYCLILGNFGFPALGVRGAAISTVIAMFVNMMLLAGVFRRGVLPNLLLPLRLEPIDRPLARELYRIGAPAALDMVILNAGFLSLIGFLGRIDEIAVAAHGIGLRVQGLAFVPGLAVSQATGAMVGQALGAGDVDRARAITRASIALCCAIMTVLALIFVFAAYPLVHVFDVRAHTALEAYSVQWLRLLGYTMLPVGVHIALVGLLQGAGATSTSLRINIVTTLALQIPLGALLGFGFHLGALGVWLSMPLAFVSKAALEYLAYKRERWAVTGVKLESPA